MRFVRGRLLGRAAAIALVSALALGATPVRAELTPATGSLTIQEGSSATEAKTVAVPAKPPTADIEIAIDTTGSMTPSIEQAKTDATNLVTSVQASVSGAEFAVVQFKDKGDTPEYQVRQALTGSAGPVQTAVNGLSAGGGGDTPEAYDLVYHNTFTPSTGGDIGWRTGSRKFVVVIGDAEPHGAGSAGLAGCADTSADPNGLNTATELAGMAAAQRTLFMIRQASSASTPLQCYKSLAAAAFTGGQGVDGGSSFASQIVSLINAATTTVANVHLAVASASPAPASAAWISSNPASAGPVTPPATLNFTLKASVPAGTPAGAYHFDVEALADGADIGHQALTITVTPANHAPSCAGVKLDRDVIWPPDHKLVKVTAAGATDPDPGDTATLVIDGVTQDEPVNGLGDGDTSPDAALTSPHSNVAWVRAERSGTGDGRVYRLHFTATDTHGATCAGVVKVGVPHDQGAHRTPVDSAPPGYDSLTP